MSYSEAEIRTQRHYDAEFALVDPVAARVVVETRSIYSCVRCRIGIEAEEFVVNFGICESCFEEDCPCNHNNSKACPLHRWPDVVLSFSVPWPGHGSGIEEALPRSSARGPAAEGRGT